MLKTIVRKCIVYSKNEGPTQLMKKGMIKAYKNTYYNALVARGHYSLEIDGISAIFTAKKEKEVDRNHQRLEIEKNIIADLLNEVNEDDTVYDIGANTGLYTIFAAHKCKNGDVVAFEPYQPNIETLKDNLSYNDLRNVDVVDVALSDSTGEVEFSQPDNYEVGYGSSSISAYDTANSITVPTTRGDELITCGEIPKPNVVKIDVEGAEQLVVDGLKDGLKSPSCRLLYCEVHLPRKDGLRPSITDFGSSLSELQSTLEDFGFDIDIIERSSSDVHIKGVKNGK